MPDRMSDRLNLYHLDQQGFQAETDNRQRFHNCHNYKPSKSLQQHSHVNGGQNLLRANQLPDLGERQNDRKNPSTEM